MARFLFAAVLTGALVSSPSFGQTLGAVEQRLEKIESTLAKVERRVGKVREEAPKNPIAPVSAPLTNDLIARLASLERLVSEMVADGEQDQRALTLAIDQLTRVKADTEQRLEAIEQQTRLLSEVKQAGVAVAPAAEAKILTADERYLEALGFAEKKEWTKAEFAFDTFIAANPAHSRINEARFWLGKSFQGQGKAAQAGQVFLELFEKYPDASFAVENLFALAQSLTDLGPETADQACAVYDQIDSVAKNRLTDVQRSTVLDGRLLLKCHSSDK